MTEGTNGGGTASSQQGLDLGALQRGFRVPPVSQDQEQPSEPPRSSLSLEPAVQFAQMVDLDAGEGTVLFYPRRVVFNIGDVLYLRERESGENGVVVQALEESTASYPQADSKALFRLTTSVRASQIERNHNEPPEIVDEFLALRFKVRAEIVDGQWRSHEGRVVTRNVDIFRISPALLLENVVRRDSGAHNLNLSLGHYQGAPVDVFGGAFEKINLVTGMKGSGKSHITKGIISESLVRGMSAVVFAINDEYSRVADDTLLLAPGRNLRFRLDYMGIGTFFHLVEELAPFAERTAFAASAAIPGMIRDRQAARDPATGRHRVPDLGWLIDETNRKKIASGTSEAANSMRQAYVRSINILDGHGLIMTEDEAWDEDASFKRGQTASVISLRTAFHNMLQGHPQVVVFQIGGLLPKVQKVIVSMVLDHLVETCNRQASQVAAGTQRVPVYPTVYFE